MQSKKNYLFLILLFCNIFSIFGQDYVFNPLTLNPALTGSSDNLRAFGSYGSFRTPNQRLFDYYYLSVDAPVTKLNDFCVGLQAAKTNLFASSGATLNNLVLSASYRFKTPNGNYFATGVQVFDNSASGAFKYGIGASYYGKIAGLGISVPSFQNPNLPLIVHGNLVMQGKAFTPNDRLKLSSVLYRIASKTAIDIGATFYTNNLGLGLWVNNVKLENDDTNSPRTFTATADYSVLSNLKLGLGYSWNTDLKYIQVTARYEIGLFGRELQKHDF